MIRSIIFDFDGVIAESINVKTEAFKQLFKNRPQHLEAITRFHITNGGLSRYNKFRHIYHNILNEELSETEFKRLCEDFSALVLNKVIQSSFVPGIRQLLENLFNRYKMYIVSGTPQEEMRLIIEKKGLKKYFSGIYGSPETKTNLIKRILNNAYKPNEAVFIGDSLNDLAAAKDTGIHFIARILNDGNDYFNNAGNFPKFKNFNNIEGFLDRLEKMY